MAEAYISTAYVYIHRITGYTDDGKRYKKLSCPQRKCASNVAILYGADGISI